MTPATAIVLWTLTWTFNGQVISEPTGPTKGDCENYKTRLLGELVRAQSELSKQEYEARLAALIAAKCELPK